MTGRDEPQWHWMWLDDNHMDDVQRNVDRTRAPSVSEAAESVREAAELVGIVDVDEGIVAYALGPGNAARIIAALNGTDD